jgi:hypothetical protein
MANKPSAEQIEKLPKWAQDRIRDLEHERELSVRSLNEFVDGQTESRIWVDELVCTGERAGPTTKRHYIQSRKITIMVGKTEVHMGLDLDDSSRLGINCGGRTMVFQPVASNSIKIIDQS